MSRALMALSLLFAAPAAAEEDTLGRVVDPRAVPLAPVDWASYRKLAPDDRILAKGVDPAQWLRPSPDRTIEERTLGWVEKHGHQPGFRFDERLATKRRMVLRLLEGKDARFLYAILRRLGDEWPAFEESVLRLEEDLRRAAPEGSWRAAPDAFRAWIEKNQTRLAKLQAQLALRRSELDFHDWFARELGARFAKDDAAGDAFTRGLGSDCARVRLFCAGALAERGAAMGGLLRDALASERSATVAAQMVALLGRVDPTAPAGALEDPRWQVTAAAIEALGALKTPGTPDVLRGRLLLEEGRLEEDIRAALGEAAPPARNPSVEFFGIGSRSRRVVFCLDISPSMAMAFNTSDSVPRFEMARRDLSRTLDAMSPEVRFGIVTFHGRTVRWRPGLVPATEESKQAARAFIDGITFEEAGTNVVDAILECVDGLGTPAERFDADTVYMLSDGSSSVGPLIDTREIVAELALRLRGRRVVVHTIGISSDQNAELLSNLSRVTGGRYVDFRE